MNNADTPTPDPRPRCKSCGDIVQIDEYDQPDLCFSCGEYLASQPAPDPRLQSLRDLYEDDDVEIIDDDTVRIGEMFFPLCQNCASAVSFMGHPICIECATDIANAMDAEPDNPDMQTIEYGEIAQSISEYLYGIDTDDDDTAEDDPIGWGDDEEEGEDYGICPICKSSTPNSQKSCNYCGYSY